MGVCLGEEEKENDRFSYHYMCMLKLWLCLVSVFADAMSVGVKGRRTLTYTHHLLPPSHQNPSRRNGLQCRPRRLLLDKARCRERGDGPLGAPWPSDEPLLLYPAGKFSIFTYLLIHSFYYDRMNRFQLCCSCAPFLPPFPSCRSSATTATARTDKRRACYGSLRSGGWRPSARPC